MLDRAAVCTLEGRTLGPKRDDLAVARELHGARLAEECRGVRGEEHLVRADAHDERYPFLTSADEKPRMVVVDHDEGEVPFELGECEAHGLDEVAFVVALDEMRDGLGVGLGRERVAVGDEALR